MRKPEVSVVIPAYNCTDTIEQAIESVLIQKENTEILIVDDCSSDGLKERLEDYISDGRVKYVRNEKNQRVAYTRNRGVSLAEGEYVAFLDADDWWEPGKLSAQLKAIKETGAVLCCTSRRLHTHEGTAKNKVIGVKEKITYRDLLYHNSIACSSVLVKTSAAKEFPMGNDECHEDYICWLQILKKYGFACGLSHPYLNYRLSRGSKSRNKWKSAKMTWQVYRLMGLPLIQRLYYFAFYAVHGVIKYI